MSFLGKLMIIQIHYFKGGPLCVNMAESLVMLMEHKYPPPLFLILDFLYLG